jgi:hypothetical protein
MKRQADSVGLQRLPAVFFGWKGVGRKMGLCLCDSYMCRSNTRHHTRMVCITMYYIVLATTSAGRLAARSSVVAVWHCMCTESERCPRCETLSDVIHAQLLAVRSRIAGQNHFAVGGAGSEAGGGRARRCARPPTRPPWPPAPSERGAVCTKCSERAPKCASAELWILNACTNHHHSLSSLAYTGK